MNEMNSPLITIITVSYNAVSTIEATILSIIYQTYTNIEYIIIDGGSTDGTLDIIKKYENKIAKWISEPDKGIYDAMNKGISLATGEWINFMNCGDSFYCNTVIDEIFSVAQATSDIIYGNTNEIFKIGNFIKKGSTPTSQNYMPFCHQSSFTRTSILKDNKFNITFKLCADRNFFFHAFKNNHKFEYLDKTIANYEADAGLSALNTITILKEIAKIEGKDHNFAWKLYFIIFVTNFRFKQFLKSLLPQKIVNTIKIYNQKKMTQE